MLHQFKNFSKALIQCEIMILLPLLASRSPLMLGEHLLCRKSLLCVQLAVQAVEATCRRLLHAFTEPALAQATQLTRLRLAWELSASVHQAVVPSSLIRYNNDLS